MGTRSRIGVVNPDDSITSIYCHWDGYPEHHLPILTGHYTTEDKVADLIALGSLSSLEPEIGVRHNFDWVSKPPWGDQQAPLFQRMCVSHFRDLGDMTRIPSLDARQGFMERCVNCGAEWLYLFNDGKWEHGQP